MVLANAIALLYLYYYLQDVIHYRKPGQGQLILVMIATALAAIFAGRFADRSGAYQMYVVLAMGLTAVAGYVLAAVGTWTIAVIAAALGAGYGVFESAGRAGRAGSSRSRDRRAGPRGYEHRQHGAQVIGPPVAAARIYLGGGYRGLFAFAATMACWRRTPRKIRVPG